jgi:hypothetical protein
MHSRIRQLCSDPCSPGTCRFIDRLPAELARPQSCKRRNDNSHNLVSVEGLHRILLGMVENYVGFAPLGIVMVAMLGIGVAKAAG